MKGIYITLIAICILFFLVYLVYFLYVKNKQYDSWIEKETKVKKRT